MLFLKREGPATHALMPVYTTHARTDPCRA